MLIVTGVLAKLFVTQVLPFDGETIAWLLELVFELCLDDDDLCFELLFDDDDDDDDFDVTGVAVAADDGSYLLETCLW